MVARILLSLATSAAYLYILACMMTLLISNGEIMKFKQAKGSVLWIAFCISQRIGIVFVLAVVSFFLIDAPYTILFGG